MREKFNALPKDTKQRLTKLLAQHEYVKYAGEEVIIPCFYKQEMDYFLKNEAVQVLDSMYLDQLAREGLSVEEVAKRELIGYNIIYNAIFRDIDEMISKMKLMKNSNVVLLEKMRIFATYYNLIKYVYTYDNIHNTYGGIFEELKKSKLIQKIIKGKFDRLYLHNEKFSRVFIEYSLNKDMCYLRLEKIELIKEDKIDTHKIAAFDNAELVYDVLNKKLSLKTDFENLTPNRIANANYRFYKIMNDRLFASLIDVFTR